MSFAIGLRQALQLRRVDVVAELRRGDSLQDILNRHLLVVEGMSDNEILTSVLLLSADGKRLTHGAGPRLPQPYREAIDGSEIGPSAGSCGTAAYLDSPVYVTDISTDPLWAEYRDLALPHGLRSCWSTPIRHANGDVMGTFAIYQRTVGGPTKDDLASIEIITDNVAKAIAWVRDPDARTDASDLLLRQVAALGALVAAIRQQASTLDDEGRTTIDAIVKDSEKLAEVVQRNLSGPDVSQA
jgi:GAF domain-containing protein